MAEVAASPQTALANIAAYETTLQRGLGNRFLRAVGQTRFFAALYRRIGPRIDTWLNRRFGGRVASRIWGVPALILITTGAKSGLPRPSPLLYVRDGNDFIVVGTNFGHATHPAWTGNLTTNPSCRVQVGADELTADGVPVPEANFQRYWAKFVEMYPGYRGYIERSGRTPRMFRLKPDGA